MLEAGIPRLVEVGKIIMTSYLL